MLTPDPQMRQSMQSVLHCYERRARENAHLVSLIQTHQASLVRVQRENAELKREKQELHASRNALAARFAALKKTAIELEAFRRGIATMVETGGGRKTEASILQASINIEDSMALDEEEESERRLTEETLPNGVYHEDDQTPGSAEQRADGIADDRTMHSVELRHSGSFELNPPARRNESFSVGPSISRVSDRNTRSLGQARCSSSGPTTTADRVARSISGPDLRQVIPAKVQLAARTFSASLGPAGTHLKQQPQRESYNASSPTHKRTTSTNASTTPTPASVGRRSQQPQQQPGPNNIDAAGLYREIRKRLAPADFEAFASSVAAFNAGTQSPKETVERVAGIVKDRRLASCMSDLIYSAIEEAKVVGTMEKKVVGNRVTKSVGDASVNRFGTGVR
ncbi:hypothetical protein HDU87_006736 [Geranomyces variabilis]|uniref:At4g15545-like C-terminal domain-containing protein n=1 Tax=Geranomyces variabilis TaxID=109894 RepID=A0AAD5TRU4_9FUNG|nr:hypothetical protein HDU87_006736 [Geranomyces variabilis]